MYKKIACFAFVLFLLTGCGIKVGKLGFGKALSEDTVSSKPIETSSINCYTDDSSFELILSKGQIVRYIDSVDGELGQETVDILNQEHLVGVTSDEEALSIMSAALSDLNGYCE